jgi:protein-S-isoprenylcysteine O-methyltransferase Ste14
MDRQNNSFTPRVVLPLLLLVVIVPFLPLLLSRRWDWWEAWVYGLACTLAFIVSRILVVRRHPDLLAERAKFMDHDDTKPWDRIMAPLVAVGGGLVPLVAALDAVCHWSAPFCMPVKIVSLLIILAGFALSAYAFFVNRFFSGTVRIQTERGHKVVSEGPYGWVRHPGYTGSLATFLASPVFLDSWWAFVPAVASTAILAFRTALEDRTLQNELEGYPEYARRVRYRLLPGIW